MRFKRNTLSALRGLTCIGVLLYGLALAAPSLFAQKPGYLGKRFSAGGTVLTGIHLENMDYNGKDIVGFRMRYNLYCEYVVGRRVQLGINYGFLRTGTTAYEDVPDGVPNLNPNTSYSVDGRLQIRGQTTEIYTLISSRKLSSLSPVGKFVKLGLGVVRYNYDFIAYEPIFSKANETSSGVSGPYLIWGIGAQRIIKDRVTLKYGFDSAVWFYGPGAFFSIYSATGLKSGEAIDTRLGQLLSFNPYLSVGVLIF